MSFSFLFSGQFAIIDFHTSSTCPRVWIKNEFFNFMLSATNNIYPAAQSTHRPWRGLKSMKTFSRDFIVRMQLRQILQSCASLSFLSPILLVAAVNAIAIISVECCIIAFLVFPVMIATFYVWAAKSCAKWVWRLDFFFMNILIISIMILGFIFFAEQSSLWFSQSPPQPSFSDCLSSSFHFWSCCLRRISFSSH